MINFVAKFLEDFSKAANVGFDQAISILCCEKNPVEAMKYTRQILEGGEKKEAENKLKDKISD